MVEVNGEPLISSTGSGAVTWTPQYSGNFTLTHKVMFGEEQIGETLMATFLVEGLKPGAPVISPVGGATFDSSLSVSMTCPTEGATIHYATDGSEPTAESPGDDAAWVANYSWASAWTATRTTEGPVSYAWLTAHDPDVVDEYEAYEASAKKTAANGYKVWDCYVVGLDPQEPDEFRITAFPMKADGTPDLANLAVEPPQARWNVPGARPVVKGAATLDGEWKPVEEATPAERAAMRFFKMAVIPVK